MKKWKKWPRSKEVFEGIGKYKGPPVEIQVEEGVRPVVQPPRRRPHLYQEPLREHIQELLEAVVIESRHGKSGKSSASRFAFSNFRLGEIPNLSLFSGFFR